eukprot:943060-Prorocentrum_minimum.AAC.1
MELEGWDTKVSTSPPLSAPIPCPWDFLWTPSATTRTVRVCAFRTLPRTRARRIYKSAKTRDRKRTVRVSLLGRGEGGRTWRAQARRRELYVMALGCTPSACIRRKRSSAS